MYIYCRKIIYFDSLLDPFLNIDQGILETPCIKFDTKRFQK